MAIETLDSHERLQKYLTENDLEKVMLLKDRSENFSERVRLLWVSHRNSREKVLG